MASTTSKELLEKAKNELGEDPSRIQDDINVIRDWISKQTHLHARTDDVWLLMFLRGGKYSLEKTKTRIENFYISKTVIPEFFSNRDPLQKDIQEALRTRSITILPKTAGPTEPKLIFCRSKLCIPELVHASIYTKTIFMLLDILCMEDPNSTIAGISMIVDLGDMNYKYVNQMTPSFLKKAITCFRNAHPLRIKAVYFINAPKFFQVVYSAIKLMVNEKFNQRMRFYANVEDLYSELSQSIFPKDYGGEQPSCDDIADEWKSKVESYRNWFLEDAQYRSEDSNRAEDLYSFSELFGIEGSFKKLDLD